MWINFQYKWVDPCPKLSQPFESYIFGPPKKSAAFNSFQTSPGSWLPIRKLADETQSWMVWNMDRGAWSKESTPSSVRTSATNAAHAIKTYFDEYNLDRLGLKTRWPRLGFCFTLIIHHKKRGDFIMTMIYHDYWSCDGFKLARSPGRQQTLNIPKTSHFLDDRWWNW